MSKMRQTVARNLKNAQNENAMLTTFNEVDMSAYMAMRKDYGELFLKKHGIKLGFMSGAIKASALALADQPVINACIDGNDIVTETLSISVSQLQLLKDLLFLLSVMSKIWIWQVVSSLWESFLTKQEKERSLLKICKEVPSQSLMVVSSAP